MLTFYLQIMNSKNLYKKLIIIPLLSILSFNTILVAQITDLTKTESEAKKNFLEGNFKAAVNVYHTLYTAYPQNPEYQYYIGRCLLELRTNPTEAIDNLRFAAVKGNKSDSWFYLGQAYYENADFEKAISSYKRFIRDGKKSEIKKTRVNEFLAKTEKELEDNNENKPITKNSVEENRAKNVDTKVENTESLPRATDYKQKENDALQVESTKESKINNSSESATQHDIEPNFNSNPLTKDSVNEDLAKALRLQLLADSLSRESKMKRSQLKETEGTEEKNRLAREISVLEKESTKNQKEADKYYIGIQSIPSKSSQNDTLMNIPSAIELKEEINGIKVYQYKEGNSPETERQDGEQASSALTLKDDRGNIKKIMNEFTLSEVPVYTISHPVPTRNSFPDLLVYYVQLGAYSKKIDDNSFKGFSPVSYDYIIGRGIYKYYAGLFSSFKTANESLPKIKTNGFTDSFIVAFYKNEQISVEKAQQIEYSQYKF